MPVVVMHGSGNASGGHVSAKGTGPNSHLRVSLFTALINPLFGKLSGTCYGSLRLVLYGNESLFLATMVFIQIFRFENSRGLRIDLVGFSRRAMCGWPRDILFTEYFALHFHYLIHSSFITNIHISSLQNSGSLQTTARLEVSTMSLSGPSGTSEAQRGASSTVRGELLRRAILARSCADRRDDEYALISRATREATRCLHGRAAGITMIGQGEAQQGPAHQSDDPVRDQLMEGEPVKHNQHLAGDVSKFRNTGSLVAGKPALIRPRQVMSFMRACLAVRPCPRRHEKPCEPSAMTNVPQGHWTQRSTPRRSPVHGYADGLIIEPQATGTNG